MTSPRDYTRRLGIVAVANGYRAFGKRPDATVFHAGGAADPFGVEWLLSMHPVLAAYAPEARDWPPWVRDQYGSSYIDGVISGFARVPFGNRAKRARDGYADGSAIRDALEI